MARNRLAQFHDDIASGIQPAVPLEKVILWKTSNNVVFRNGGVRPEPGQVQFLEKLQDKPVLGLVELLVDTNRVLVWGTEDKLFRGSPTATPRVSEVGTGYSGVSEGSQNSPQTRWSIESWGKWVVAANGVDNLQVDKDDGSDFVDVSGVPSEFSGSFQPRIILKHRNHLLAFNADDGTELGPQRYWWCDADDLEEWEPAADNTAGRNTIADMPSPIRAAVELGGFTGVYSSDTLHFVSYVGPPFIFATQLALTGLGAFGPHSVVNAGRIHYGLGPRGFFRTDGTQVQYIGHPFVHDYIFDDFSRERASETFLWHDPSLERVVMFFRGSEGNGRALGFDYRHNTFHEPSFFRTAGSSASVFDFPITADVNGNVFLQGDSDEASGINAEPLRLDDVVYFRTGGWGEIGWGQGGWGGFWRTE